MKHYLVTGGAGFIGSHITSALLEQGAFVRVLDNLSTGRRENLSALADIAGPGHLEVIEADLREPAKVAQAVADVEVVFHEAAFVSVPESIERPEECFDVNVAGTSALFEAARRSGVQRVVVASSAAVYGDSVAVPLGEDSKAQPLSPYAVSKLFAESCGHLYTRTYGLEVVCLRYFNVYGPRQRPDSPYAAVVPIFIQELLASRAVTLNGDGGQTRDLIFVEDVVRANLVAAEHPGVAGAVFNVCTGRATRILDLLATLSDLIPGAPPPIFAGVRAGDIYQSVGNPQKAEAELGFRATTSLADGLRTSVESLR